MITDSIPGIDEVFEEIDGILEYIITFHIPFLNNTEAIQCHLDDPQFQQRDLDSSIIVPLYNEFLQYFINPWIIIAKDASKTHAIMSIVKCTASSKFSWRVHPINSIFTIEILAICTTLNELCIWNQPIVFLTDSLSVLKMLLSVIIKFPSVILWLYNKLQRASSSLCKIWIYSALGHWTISLTNKLIDLLKICQTLM